MSALDEFENILKDVVSAKRLSASKMNKLTEIALKTLNDDAKLVAILYRTHKSLPDSAKVSSLYAFDALARAARSSVTKHGLTADVNPGKGNAATFLLKMEGVLEGLFRDMIAINNAEAKVSCLVYISPCKHQVPTTSLHELSCRSCFNGSPSQIMACPAVNQN